VEGVTLTAGGFNGSSAPPLVELDDPPAPA
jgi:hypothetical protein